MKKHIFILIILVFISGCLPPNCVPYRPLPGLEKQLYNVAKRKVTPNNVRKLPDKYIKTLVVWTGIIKNIDSNKEQGTEFFQITVEHHYFDWIENRGAQKEMFFLSPRGEGTFIAAWSAGNAQEYEFIRHFTVGDMIIAYGRPCMTEDDILVLNPTVNIRPVKPQWFSTEIPDYGASITK